MGRLEAFDGERIEPEETRNEIISVAKELLELAQTCYGPHGRSVLIQANEACFDAFTITSIGSRLFECIKIDHPSATLIMQLLQSHMKEYRDCTLFAVIFSMNLLLKAFECPLLENVPREQIIQGYQLALEWSIKFMNSTECKSRHCVEWSDVNAIKATVRGILSPKKMTNLYEEDLEHLIDLVLKGFLSCIHDVMEYPYEPLNVRFHKAPSSQPTESKVLPNTILIEVPSTWYHISKLPLSNVVIALFNISIQENDHSSYLTIESDNLNMEELYHEEAMIQYQNLTFQLVSLNVQFVLSQKKIPHAFAQMLLNHQILSLERLSLKHIGAMQALSGATFISNWRTILSKSDLGFLASIDHIPTRNHRPLLSFTSSPSSLSSKVSRNVMTFSLACADQVAYEELEYLIHSALTTLQKLLLDPMAFEGAGALEQEVICHLHNQVARLKQETSSKDVREIVRAVECFIESIPFVLDHVMSREHLDFGRAKLSALSSSVTIASTLLRSLLEKEELRVGEVIAYYSSTFVAGDPRGRRESQVVRIRSDTTHEYPISLVSADILTKNTLIKRVKDLHGESVELPQGKWRKVYTFELFPGKYRVENAHTILKAAMKNVIKDSFAAVYGKKAKENSIAKVQDKNEPKPMNISKFFMPKNELSKEKSERGKELSPFRSKSTPVRETIKKPSHIKQENVRSSQNSTPQARSPPMMKRKILRTLPDIEEVLRNSTPKPVKRELSKDKQEEKKSKKAKVAIIEMPPSPLEIDDFVIPKKSQQKANLSIETKELQRLPAAQSYKNTQTLAVIITPSKSGKPPTTNRPMDDTLFTSPTGLKKLFSSPSPNKQPSPKTIRVNEFVKTLDAEEKFEEKIKSPIMKAPPKTPVTGNTKRWLQSRKHIRQEMNKTQPTLTQFFGSKQ
ncbi:hypothetical protein THRCLA_10050 [Thraustotheca clavata]|uniref:Uncharacterized protein n=1 Tax=Thraustotheca clavata TaxID=74557 RepID=A0A1V9YSY2_9STRA|nr:hypothetical protein THRCLA_10050 [Thraustotheca clavata]